MNKKRCDYCRRWFQPVRDWHRFCTSTCRNRYWQQFRRIIHHTEDETHG